VKKVNISVNGHKLCGFLKSRQVFLSGPRSGCDILLCTGSKATYSALSVVKFSERRYGEHLPKITTFLFQTELYSEPWEISVH